MKVNAVTNNCSMTNRNINKNNSPSFGKITNMAELKAGIKHDVESGYITPEFAKETIEGLENIRFDMTEALDRYIKRDLLLSSDPNLAKLKQIYNEFYLPLLAKSNVDYTDMPFALVYSTGSNAHNFDLMKAFTDIRYNKQEKEFAPLKEDSDKSVRTLQGEYDSSPTFTECLRSFVDSGAIQYAFYSKYALKVFKDITYCSLLPQQLLKNYPAENKPN